MPQTVRVEGSARDEIVQARNMRVGKAYIVVNAPNHSWEPGYLVFRADTQAVSPSDNTYSSNIDGVTVRELRPGETITITGS